MRTLPIPWPRRRLIVQGDDVHAAIESIDRAFLDPFAATFEIDHPSVDPRRCEIEAPGIRLGLLEKFGACNHAGDDLGQGLRRH